MNITFEKPVMVFKNQTKEGTTYYTFSVSKKKEDGSYENAPMFIRFKGKPEIENRAMVTINRAFLTFSKREKKSTFYVMALDFEFGITREEPKQENDTQKEFDPFQEFGNSINAEQLDLPF